MDPSQRPNVPNLDLVRAAMMEELGLSRMDDLPMEDNIERLTRPRPQSHHHGYTPRTTPRPLARSTATERSDAPNKWTTAIAKGGFKDEDAAAVAGLDDLGGGRIYAHREEREQIRSVTRDIVSRINPIAIQRPEVTRQAAQASRPHGQQTNRLVSGHSPISTHGAVLRPGMPVRTFPSGTNRVHQQTFSGTNRVHQQTFATRNGNIIRDIIHDASTTSNVAAGPSRSATQRTLPANALQTSVTPQRSTVRSQAPATTAGAQRGRDVLATGDVLLEKRKTAEFEARAKFIKDGGTNLRKYMWAIVVVCPAQAPYMGHLFTFHKKKPKDQDDHVYILGSSIPLNLIRATADEGQQVVLRIQESEIRHSSSRLVFEDSAITRDFLANISRLMNGGVAVVPTQTLATANTATTAPTGSTKTPTQAVASTVATSGQENTSTEHVRTANVQVQAPTTPASARTATPHSVKHRDVPVSARNGGTGTVSDPFIIPSTDDTVGETRLNGRREEQNKVEGVKATTAVDFLSGSEDAFSDTATTIDHSRDAAHTTDKEDDQTFKSTLVDVDAETNTPLHSRAALQSTVDELHGLAFDPEVNPWTTEVGHDSSDIAADTPQSSDMSAADDDVDVGIRQLVQVLDDMVDKVKTLFDAEGFGMKVKTDSIVKEQVAGAVKKFATDPTFVPKLTEEQKLEVVDDWCLESGIQGEAATDDDAAEEALKHESGSPSVSSSATAVDASPCRPARREYSQEQMLDVRSNATPPPDSLRQTQFPTADRVASKKPGNKVFAKQQSVEEPVKEPVVESVKESVNEPIMESVKKPVKQATVDHKEGCDKVPVKEKTGAEKVPVKQEIVDKVSVKEEPVDDVSVKKEPDQEEQGLKQVSKQQPVTVATPSKLPTDNKPRQQTGYTVQPFGSGRPTAPFTPAPSPTPAASSPKTVGSGSAAAAASPAPTSSSTSVAPPAANVDKLERLFGKLSVDDKPAPQSSVKAASGMQGFFSAQASEESSPASKNEGAPRKVAQEQPARLVDPKVNTNGSTRSAKPSVQADESKQGSTGAKDVEAAKRELKTKNQQAQAGPAGTRANNRENVQPQEINAVTTSNGSSNGPMQQDVSAGAGLRGLGSSRWASDGRHRVQEKGRFTGLFAKK